MTNTDTSAEIDMDAVIARFGDLPTLAPIAMEVLRLAEDERATLDDIAAVISRDPGLASQLLRVANSPMYGMGGEVSSLARAAAVLGLRTVKLLSLSFSVVTRPESGDRVGERIWRHTLVWSAVAQSLAKNHEPRLADECFISSLLGNLGRLALAEEPLYVQARDDAGGWLDHETERHLLGVSSLDVTAEILAGWGLPAVLGEAIRHLDHPTNALGPAVRIAGILNVADAAAELLIATEDDAPAALEQYTARAAAQLSSNQEEIETLLLDAGPTVDEIAAMFRTDSPTEAPITDLLARAKDGLARLTLDMVVALSQEENRAEQLATENERLATEAATDALTGLPNRRTFDVTIEREISARLRHPQPHSLGLLMMDLDKFKAVNDTYGHQVGDDVLRGLAARLTLHARRDEMVARVGGEEFVVVIPVTDADEIPLAAERFRKAVAAEPFQTDAGPLEITISIGVASTANLHEAIAKELYEAADQALYEAKHGGRNRVAVSPLQ
jgi:diguanylate cyclase (GGDEF)-like protein